MRTTIRPRLARRDQTGASLVLVLALIAFLALVVPAVLGLVALGPRITKPVLEDRRELYAASSAIDAAVELGRTQPDVGVPGGPCPTQEMTIDSLDVTVACRQHASPGNGCLFLDRFVNFTADVRNPGNSTVIARAATEVVYRFDLYALPKVEIRQWTPNADPSTDIDIVPPVTTLPLPDCNSTTSSTTTTTLVPTTSTSTTTTTTPTTTTTSTTLPVGLAAPAWDPAVAATTNGQNGSNQRWRGEATILVTSTTGAPVEGATVSVTPYYRLTANGPWIEATALTGTTTSAGSNTFHSPYYRTNGNSSNPPHAVRVRFVVTGVTTPQGLSWAGDPLTPIAIEVAKP